MEQKLDSNPVKAVETAYFECVINIGKMLKSHIAQIMPDKKYPDLLFKKEKGDPSLYDYRNKIAHGRLDALNEKEIDNARKRISDAKNAATDYLLRILNLAIDNNQDLEQAYMKVKCGNHWSSDPKLASSFNEQEKEFHMGLIYNLPSLLAAEFISYELAKLAS